MVILSILPRIKPFTQTFVRSLRTKHRYDLRYDACKMSRYSNEVEIKITRDDLPLRLGAGTKKKLMLSISIEEIDTNKKIFMYVIVSARIAFWHEFNR